MECVISQRFRWHDETGCGIFAFGDGGDLVMGSGDDGIRCSRALEEPLQSGGALEIDLRFVANRRYCVRLFDDTETPVLACRIDPDGKVAITPENAQPTECGYLSYRANPVPDRKLFVDFWYPVWTDRETFRFDSFDFETGSLRFSITGRSMTLAQEGTRYPHDETMSYPLPGMLRTGTKKITRFEIGSDWVGPGAMVRVCGVRLFDSGRVVHDETFSLHWFPHPAPPTGFPGDNCCDTVLRPVDHAWLETKTWYGWVTARIDPIVAGEIEFDMKASNVDVESVIQLGSYDPVTHYHNTMEITVGILENRIVASWIEQPRSFRTHHSEAVGKEIAVGVATGPGFRDLTGVPPENNRVYHFLIRWNGRTKEWAVQVDGVEYVPDPGDELRLIDSFQSVSAVSLHPGWAGARVTFSEQRTGSQLFKRAGYAEPQRAYWGNLSIRNHDAGEKEHGQD